MKCESLYSGFIKLNDHIYKALLNRLTSDKFDTLPRNFYQHHNFYNLLMSSPSKNDVTYKLKLIVQHALLLVKNTQLQWL